VQDLTALDAYVRGAAASTPECGGAQQGLAGVTPGRRSRPSLRMRIGATRSEEVHAHA
jgi:hypothetical protein